LARDNATVDSASTYNPFSADSPLFAVDSPSALPADLNFVVDFSSYLLQQIASLPPSSLASPSLISRHPMVLRPWQSKTTNLVASTAAVTASTRVLHSPSSETFAFSDTDRYAVWHDAM
jgi:hypothetical protein